MFLESQDSARVFNTRNITEIWKDTCKSDYSLKYTIELSVVGDDGSFLMGEFNTLEERDAEFGNILRAMVVQKYPVYKVRK